MRDKCQRTGQRLLPTSLSGVTVMLLTAAPLATAQVPTGIALEEVVTGLSHPVYLTHAGDGSGRLFIVEQGGSIRVVRGGKLLPTPFLDLSPLVRSGGERGLLSVAFHPRYAANGFFYVNYTNRSGDTVVARYTVSANPDRADATTAAVVLIIHQPYSNHNGGQLQFGPDGYLYIGMGDGGSAGDPHGHAQNPNSLLGKMLRIDVSAVPHAIPKTNPFVGPGPPLDEVWALGLRNPWRFSFDRQTGDLYIADVGQDSYEEVDIQPAGSQGGENYGWNIMEGAHCFSPQVGCPRAGLTMPVATYRTGENCAITGGYMYRGTQVRTHIGTYIFGDYCSGRIWGLQKTDRGGWTFRKLLDTDLHISSFGEDEPGELYAVDHGGAIYRLTEAAPAAQPRTPER
ncbi:MAG: PQQ-dependent sugar dehydrogenase [Candidatus Methylomirabilales bacterium]